MSTQGTLIVIEGADGAGKATQTARLVERLKKDGQAVETLSFPRYRENVFGQLLDDCLHGGCKNYMELDARVVSTLFAADRFESKGILEDWLKEGKIVVLDRYVTSNMIHQGARTDGSEMLGDLFAWIEKVEYEVFGVPKPDLVIYLDVPTEERRRLSLEAGKNDLAERHVAHQAAADQVGKLAAEKFGWAVIDCMKGGNLCAIEDIAERVYNQVVSVTQ